MLTSGREELEYLEFEGYPLLISGFPKQIKVLVTTLFLHFSSALHMNARQMCVAALCSAESRALVLRCLLFGVFFFSFSFLHVWGAEQAPVCALCLFWGESASLCALRPEGAVFPPPPD